MEKNLLQINNLKVTVEDKIILEGFNLNIDKGQIHVLMGPNGSGKSTLAYTLMGHLKYQIMQGDILFLGQNLKDLTVDKRAKLGIFLALQYPVEVSGVSLKNFLRQAYNSMYMNTEKQLDLKSFNELLEKKAKILKIEPGFVNRDINVGFSGGEKKKAEILQMAVLQPKFVILDEIDSGLDVDALKTVCEKINKVKLDNPEMSVLIITHYPRILQYLKPDFVHVIQKGEIVKSGDRQLAEEIEKIGYQQDLKTETLK